MARLSTRGSLRAAAPGLLLLLAGGCGTVGVPRSDPLGDVPPVVEADSTGLKVYGRADYDWILRTLRGERVPLGDHRGRVLFVNVWASWCAPCVAEMASIERLRSSLRDAEVEFLLVSPEDPEPVERFLKRYGYDLPVFLEVGPMPEAFGLRALPTTYVVDRSGNIVLRYRGAAEWDDPAIRDFLRALAQ